MTEREKRRGAAPRPRAVSSGHAGDGPRKARAPESRDPIALGALLALTALMYGSTLGMGFVERDLLALDTVLRTQFGALLRGGALPGAYAPLSTELYWWWWGRILQLGPTALHTLNAAIAVAGGWLLFRATERLAGPRAATLATLSWALFPPLGAMFGAVSGARELIAVLGAGAALASFAGGRWILAGLACGLAGLAGRETLLLPIAMLAADLVERPSDRVPARLPRILPAVAACAVAALILARAEPGSTPAPLGAATPVAFARSWMPEWTLAGLASAWRQSPLLLVFAAALAALAVPRRSGGAASLRLVPVGLTAGLAPLLPLAWSPAAPRAEGFAVAAFGLAIAAGALAKAPAWPARAVLAALALASVGANAARPGPSAPPSRFTPLAALHDQAAATAPLMAALRPWCGDLVSVPRVFATGLPTDSLFRLVLSSGARVTCRDSRATARFLAEMTPTDAATPFGVLRFDAARAQFQFERADARVRALVGEGLLLFARHEAAAACFEAAAAERPGDREMLYPRVIALAAARRTEEAQALWEEARRAGTAPSADTLALRFLAGDSEAGAAGARSEVARLAEEVLRDPTAAAPHLALGRTLLERGRTRAATLEISTACGIGRRSPDVYWLARGYEELGASAEALEAYRAALAGGLDSTVYDDARARFGRLLRSLGPRALGIANR